MLAVWLLVAGALVIVNGNARVPLATSIGTLSVMLSSLGLISAVLLARPARLRTALSELRLGPWTAVGFSIVFGVTTLVWSFPVTGSMNVVNLDYLVPAGEVAAAGLLAMVAGYLLTPRSWTAGVNRLDAELRGRPPQVPSALAVLVLWAVSVVSTLLQVRVGSFGYLSDPSRALQETGSTTAVLAVLADLGLVATLLAAWRLGQSATAGSRLMLVTVTGSQILIGLFAAEKETVTIQLVALFVGYGCQRRVRVLPVLLGAVAVILFVFPFVGQYRDQVASNAGRLTPDEAIARIDYAELVDDALDASSSTSANTASARLTRIGDLAVILQKTPSTVPYRSATDLAAGPFLGLVPRSVWAQKPVLDAAYQMSSVYYGLPASVHTSSALTPYGDLWRHGGLWVVLAGMALMGVLARVIDGRTGDPRSDPRLLFLPMLLFAPFVKQETGFLGFTASLVSIVLVAALASRIVTLTSRGADPPGHPHR